MDFMDFDRNVLDFLDFLNVLDFLDFDRNVLDFDRNVLDFDIYLIAIFLFIDNASERIVNTSLTHR